MASNFADTYGFSATGMSMGNAMTASVNDWSSVYYNMGGLGRTEHLKRTPEAAAKAASSDLDQLALFSFYTYPVFNIDTDQSGVLGDKNLDFGVVSIGIVFDINNIYRLPSFVSSARFGLGLGAIMDGSAQKVNDIDLRTHNYMRYGREAQKLMILAGTGFGFMDDLFGIGIGVNAGFQGEGKVKITNVTIGGGTQVPEAQSKLDLKVKPVLVAGLYISPGQAVSFLKRLEFGAAYRMESYTEISPFETGAEMEVGSVAINMDMAIFDYYTPHIIAAGVSYTRWDLTVALDCELQLWSLYKVSETVVVVYARLEENYGADYHIPDLNNIFVPRLGLSYELFDWLTVMGGYSFEMSFIPDEALEGAINFLDNTKHIGSVGARFAIPKFGELVSPVSIIIGAQFQYLVERDVTKNNEDLTNNLNRNYTFGGMNPTGFFEISIML
ncbi:MAG: hypothetical protein GY754_40565 [bacterium]|nr:hypothetical protein [bacterium]